MSDYEWSNVELDTEPVVIEDYAWMARWEEHNLADRLRERFGPPNLEDGGRFAGLAWAVRPTAREVADAADSLGPVDRLRMIYYWGGILVHKDSGSGFFFLISLPQVHTESY